MRKKDQYRSVLIIIALLVCSALMLLSHPAVSSWLLATVRDEQLSPLEKQTLLDHLSEPYKAAYDMASDRQKIQLEAIAEEEDYDFECPRRVLEIMHVLSGTEPRLTLFQAQAICREAKIQKSDRITYDIEQIKEAFNEIAGAPDRVGGSGFTHIIYYLNDAKTQSIGISFFTVAYVDSNRKEQIVLTQS